MYVQFRYFSYTYKYKANKTTKMTLAGKWKMESSENFDDFLKELGKN